MSLIISKTTGQNCYGISKTTVFGYVLVFGTKYVNKMIGGDMAKVHTGTYPLPVLTTSMTAAPQRISSVRICFLLYTVSRKKRLKCFCNISYKTRAILMKLGEPFPE